MRVIDTKKFLWVRKNFIIYYDVCVCEMLVCCHDLFPRTELGFSKAVLFMPVISSWHL